MEIAINVKAAFATKRTGVEEYAYQLLRHWFLNPPDHFFRLYTDRLPAALKGQETLEDYFDSKIPANFSFRLLRARRAWTQIRLALALVGERPDIFFNPVQLLPLITPCRSVITVHDLGYEYFPEMHGEIHRRYLHHTTLAAARRATAVIAVSENTKQDLINIYKIRPQKIAVVPHGFSPPPRLATLRRVEFFVKQQKHSVDLTKPYFLFLGRLELRKNLINLVRAFEISKFRYNLPHSLILGGHPGFGYEQISYFIKSSPARKSIIETGHLGPTEKFEFLARAAALMIVSYYEGFGLPVLEAQTLGVPVIASAGSSLPEVGGKGAIFVSPADYEGIAEAMQKVVSFPQFRSHYIQHGYANARRFNWRKTADLTMQILNEVSKDRIYF